MLHALRRHTAALIARLRVLSKRVMRELHVWRLVLKDGRTPWYAKALLWFGVAYALIPFDVIPDFIPALGFVDDLFLVVLPILLAVRFVPKPVVADARQSAASRGPFSA